MDGQGKDPRIDRLPGELDKLFVENMAMLASRCDAFYEGKVYEAKSAAVICYALLHDHGKSQRSLIGQLGRKENTRFLDSRGPNLVLHSAKGAWPRTPLPFRQYRETDLCEFREWWEEQPFPLHFSDVIFTRRELIAAIRHGEGAHVAPETLEKIAAVRRSRSGWYSSVKANDDGTVRMEVGLSLAKEPRSGDPDLTEISDYELASVCAIAEEVLFSLTPEPQNRLRMQFEGYRKPYYLSEETITAERERIQRSIDALSELADLDRHQERQVAIAVANLEKSRDLEMLTSENLQAPEHAKELLTHLGIEFEVPD